MPFAGDLEALHIADVIQLINSTRQSGTLSVKGEQGESRIIFSSGYIVGANHLDGRIRIGSVLVKLNAITLEDLRQALDVQQKSGKDRKPLISTLMQMGKLREPEAFKALKTLIEITILELIGLHKGSFTFDAEAISVSTECSYNPGAMEQELNLDSQMILMDALRVFDERERDRMAGKPVQSFEELYADLLPSEGKPMPQKKEASLTAGDLGLDDLDHLEKKIPAPVSVFEMFDPLELHRKKLRELLAGFPAEQLESFATFLGASNAVSGLRELPARKDVRSARSLILFSSDRLLSYVLMTLCKKQGAFVFSTDSEEEFDRILSQCLNGRSMPILIFDSPDSTERGLSEQSIASLRQKTRQKHSLLTMLQLTSDYDKDFMMQAYHAGARAVMPKPVRKTSNENFISDMMRFLETFTFYLHDFPDEQDPQGLQEHLRNLKESLIHLSGFGEPSDVSLSLLQYVSGMCMRAVTLFVRPGELAGERAIGIFSEKEAGPSPASQLKLAIIAPSVFHEIIGTGRPFFGESNDDAMLDLLYRQIGQPQTKTLVLLPMKSRGKVVTITYGEFSSSEIARPIMDMLDIFAGEAGRAVERILDQKKASKT